MRTMVLNPIKHMDISPEHAVPTDIDKAPMCQQLVKQPTTGCLHLCQAVCAQSTASLYTENPAHHESPFSQAFLDVLAPGG